MAYGINLFDFSSVFTFKRLKIAIFKAVQNCFLFTVTKSNFFFKKKSHSSWIKLDCALNNSNRWPWPYTEIHHGLPATSKAWNTAYCCVLAACCKRRQHYSWLHLQRWADFNMNKHKIAQYTEWTLLHFLIRYFVRRGWGGNRDGTCWFSVCFKCHKPTQCDKDWYSNICINLYEIQKGYFNTAQNRQCARGFHLKFYINVMIHMSTGHFGLSLGTGIMKYLLYALKILRRKSNALKK